MSSARNKRFARAAKTAVERVTLLVVTPEDLIVYKPIADEWRKRP